MSQYDDLDQGQEPPARLGSLSGPKKPLGKLAQSARTKEISGARKIMFIIGVLNLVFGGIMFAASQFLIDMQIEQLQKQQQNVVVDQAARDQAIMGARLGAGLVLGLGAVYIVLGLIVQKAPVPITIAGLSIYLGTIAIGALLDPKSLLAGGVIGIAIRIAIVLALIRAVRAAFAYQRELNVERAARKPGVSSEEFA